MDRMPDRTAPIVRRGRVLATAAVAAAVAGLGTSAALAASHASLSLKGKTIVPYTKADRLTGALSTGKKGVLVELQQRVWPFKHSFKTVAKAHTRAHGTYSFERRPSLATVYRTVAPRAHTTSRTRAVYVVKGFKAMACEYTRHGYRHAACGTQKVPPGTYTLHVTVEWFYPASVFGKEKGKPVYTYYGKRNGSRKPPGTLRRQRTIRQRANGATSTVWRFVKTVTVPRTRYSWSLNACTKTTERTDGFGLPGAPGSHMCGAASIPNESPKKLG